MKMKLKLNSKSLKTFFAEHGEKLGLLLGVALLAWLGYTAWETKGYAKQPKNLADDARNAMNRIEDAKWVASEHNIRIPEPPYKDRAEKSMQTVDPARFAMGMPFNPPVRDTRVRRDEPQIYPARSLVAHYIYSAVAEGKDAKNLTGRHWIVVTGLVPYEEQVNEYRQKFENSLYPDPKRDVPDYNLFMVERAEVLPGMKDDKDLKWEPLDTAAQQAAQQGLGHIAATGIDKKFYDKYLAEPNLVMIGKTVGPEIAHEPEIPFVDPSQAVAANAAAPAAPAPPTANAQEALRGRLAELDKAASQQAGTQPQQGNKAAVPVEVPQYKLVRFYDYTVEHNKSYRYRVKLQLINPNRKLPAHFLRKPELANADTLDSAFSEPSGEVTVPGKYRVLSGDPIAARNQSQETRGRLLVVQWVPQFGADVAYEFTLERGSVLNRSVSDAQVPIPGQLDKFKDGAVDYQTNWLLLDMVGGEDIASRENSTKRYRLPGEELFLTGDGQIVMRGAIANGGDYDRSRPPIKEGKGRTTSPEPAPENDPFKSFLNPSAK